MTASAADLDKERGCVGNSRASKGERDAHGAWHLAKMQTKHSQGETKPSSNVAGAARGTSPMPTLEMKGASPEMQGKKQLLGGPGTNPPWVEPEDEQVDRTLRWRRFRNGTRHFMEGLWEFYENTR